MCGVFRYCLGWLLVCWFFVVLVFFPGALGVVFFFLLVGPSALCSDYFYLLSTGFSLAEMFQGTSEVYFEIKDAVYLCEVVNEIVTAF